jgi:hypothetical protein
MSIQDDHVRLLQAAFHLLQAVEQPMPSPLTKRSQWLAKETSRQLGIEAAIDGLRDAITRICEDDLARMDAADIAQAQGILSYLEDRRPQ